MQSEPCLNDTRAFLGEAVSELHERVDRALTLERMETVDEYRRHLRCHARVVLPLERALQASPHSRAVPDVTMRWRSEALVGDLAALGEAPPAPVPTPDANTLAALAGAMYVLEGSRLGASVLLRQIGQSAARDLPVAFLSHGAGDRLWRPFVLWLNSAQWSRTELDEMRTSARAVFLAYLAACEQGA